LSFRKSPFCRPTNLGEQLHADSCVLYCCAFTETEEGHSILSKYGSYVEAVSPAVTFEFERAVAEMKAELNE
jgi:hypothetical protein